MNTIPILLATGNQGKVAEFNRVLADFPIALHHLGEFPDFIAPPETGATFLANARLKATAAARHAGMLALADDSGLVVPALGGEPGVFSARYAGAGATDQQNIDRLLARLAEIKDRGAHFRCALSLVESGGKPLWEGEGTCHGTILKESRGTGGFGYDPVFLHPPTRQTFAQMNADEKARVSHRGEALRALRAALGNEAVPGLA